MTIRKGMGKGKGSGYYNLPPTFAHDRRTHHLAGKGIKSVQKMPLLVKNKFTGSKAVVASKQPFAVKFQSNGKTFVRFSNPKYWVKGGKGMVMVKFGKNSYTMIPHRHLKDFQAQYGGRVCKGGKFSDDAKQFLAKEWQQVKELSKEVGSGIKRAYEYEKEHLPDQLSAIEPRHLIQSVAKGTAKTATKLADAEESVKQYFKDIAQATSETKKGLKAITKGERAEAKLREIEKKKKVGNLEIFEEDKKPKLKEVEADEKKKAKIAEMKLIRPEIKKMDRQIKRVSELKRQINDKEARDQDSSHLISELEREEEDLRNLQEDMTKEPIEEMTNAELRLLAIRHREDDGFLTGLFGSSQNLYEHELVRRIKKEKEIDKEIFEAKHPAKQGKTFLAEFFEV